MLCRPASADYLRLPGAAPAIKQNQGCAFLEAQYAECVVRGCFG
jgi:hypothetical protein